VTEGTREPLPEVQRAEALRDISAARPGAQTTELWVTVAQLGFAAVALCLGEREVAMVALAAAGVYPVSRAVAKKA
jgi:hypothetical protein